MSDATGVIRADGGRILVVDDSESMRMLISYTLSDEGMDVTEAESGAAALALVEELRPEVVVCDRHMPEMDGLEVIRRLAKLDDTLPVIMLTADGEIDTVLGAVRNGAFDFVQKDGDPAPLVNAVTRALSHVRLVRDHRRLGEEIKEANRELERRVERRTAELGEANGRLEASLVALHESEARFRSLVQSASDVIAVAGEDGALRYESPAAQRMLGHPAEGLAHGSVFDAVHPEDLPAARVLFGEVIERERCVKTAQLRLRHLDGSIRWAEVTLTNLLAEPSVGGVVWNCRDTSERVALEQELTRQAFQDGLTGLANRALFRNRTGHALARAKRSGQPLAVMFIDLDGFKLINDSLGHAAGDALIVHVAQGLRRSVRDVDTCARLGGDEFALLFEDTRVEDAIATATVLGQAISASVEIQGKDVTVGASIGIALSLRGEETVDELLRNADLAMYSVKAQRTGGASVFDPSMHRAVIERMELAVELRHALERGELFVQYEPIVTLGAAQVAAVEAVPYWRHARRGVLPPEVLVPLAHQSGLACAIGRWLLHEACLEKKAWLDQGSVPFTLFVKVAPEQLSSRALVAELEQDLHDLRIDPRELVLEIFQVARSDAHEGNVELLKGLGVKIVGFGHALGARMAAMGVESAEQVAQLGSLQCDLGQGSHLPNPVDGSAPAAMLGARPAPIHRREAREAAPVT